MIQEKSRKAIISNKGDLNFAVAQNNISTQKLKFGSKCGDVFFQRDVEKFSVVCGLCELNFRNFNSFSNHFLNQHLVKWNDSKVEVKFETDAKETNCSGTSLNLSPQINESNNIKRNPFSFSFLEKKNLFCDANCENDNNKEICKSTDEKESVHDINNVPSDSKFSTSFLNFEAPSELKHHEEDDICSSLTGVLEANLEEDSAKDSNMKLNCKYCHVKFVSRALVVEHLKICKLNSMKKRVSKFSTNELTCETCKRLLPNISSLLRHRFSHIEKSKRPYKCKICLKGFNTTKNLEKHSKVHNEPRIYECDFCFIKFNSISSKNEHQRKHSVEYRLLVKGIGKKKAVLQQIENGNSENSVLEINYSVPNGYWRCEVCDKMFKNSYKPEEHKRFHENVTPFICELCGKSVVSQQMLNHHILVHKEERRFKCLKCGTSFYTSAHLKRHEQTTCNSQKLFQCEICQYRFKRKEHLTAHALTHEKNRSKDFKCEYCNAGYLTSNSLRVHKKKHMVATDGPFICNLCSAVFSSKEAVKRHERRHKNKGAFKCEHCEKKFNDKDDMQQHTKRQHFSEIKPYLCVVCNKCFIKKSHLKDHLTTHNKS
ncbi:zinc finger protein 814-like [Condylostylus longicornis]|uniref:zinc finger protein 814-like n=1 Tax=Condylostylus longicornis TaxID=2530218 RepID=UPI00244E4227|nr:zinc finger protein 814-like [Condylostylus longicornis]